MGTASIDLKSRRLVWQSTYLPQTQLVEDLIAQAGLNSEQCQRIVEASAAWVQQIRTHAKPGLIEIFLSEYGLSTDEGIAMMCLAESLLRVPDSDTIDALIEDKVASSNWSKHLGHSTSPMVNASTWALMLTGKVLQETPPGIVGNLRNVMRRLGEPVVRVAVSRAMKEIGRQFILGETINSAMVRAQILEKQGYTYSYDMLGEAARTDADANRYYLSYSRAIVAIADACTNRSVYENPGISIKLSALHPRYEEAQKDSVMETLLPRLRALVMLAKSANMGINIDAEEQDRLELSLDIIEKVLVLPELAQWDGFGIVVQAYSKRASYVIDWLYDLSGKLQRKIMVRLVKGAYWDTEIKRAQVQGLADFSVFTRKAATDISYIANARKLLTMTDRIYPQFATHNAHTVAAIIAELPTDLKSKFEFQRLHGMGEALHDIVHTTHNTRCRVYAPVGAHRDLLAYLVRRLLENGANSSFVNQLLDVGIAPEKVVEDPFTQWRILKATVTSGANLFYPERQNSKGFDLNDRPTLQAIEQARIPYKKAQWLALPLIAHKHNEGKEDNKGNEGSNTSTPIINPVMPDDRVGEVIWAVDSDVNAALSGATCWQCCSVERTAILNRAADLYEENTGEIFALLARESGKTLADAVAEIREAVDFLRYYAVMIPNKKALGRVICISPWNFPLAIFTGQIAACLAVGNAVVAKPSELTPLIAHYATGLLHQAGVPFNALQLLPAAGDIGEKLVSDSRVDGVVFTGSTATAKKIRKCMATNLAPATPLIAETGGLNAMIIDSTALLEQAVTAVIESAFQSAGQRCSALRCLYVQQDISEEFYSMLIGAMKELRMGNPWQLSTDSGPVINANAQQNITTYINAARQLGTVMFETLPPEQGYFIAPTLISVNGIADIKQEVFGPVLHVATFTADEIDGVIEQINASGYGLTFGIQSRINDRVQSLSEKIRAGNIYINRNQIGAVVGSQPFGGEGLSGTGPKAGGPLYLLRLGQTQSPTIADLSAHQWNAECDLTTLQNQINLTKQESTGDFVVMPGPTGELNQWSIFPRLPIICAGPGAVFVEQQIKAVNQAGGVAVGTNGALLAAHLAQLQNFGGVIWWGDVTLASAYDQVLANRSGAIIALITGIPDKTQVCSEQHICADTTAAGGNATLLVSGEF